MAQVTSGLVSVEDGIKRAEEYAPPRKVRVELSFSVSEGETYEGIFDTVSNAASNRVAALLGVSPVALATVGGTETPASPPAEAPKRRGRPPKADGASSNGSAGGGQTSADPAAIEDPTGGAGGDPATIHLPDESGDPASVGGDDPAAIDFDAPIEPETEEADPVTDADLNSAVQKKNADLQDPPAIRKLIASYNPDPTQVFQLRQIPADKRREFLNKLAGLKKAG